MKSTSPRLEVREDRREVAGALDGGTRRRVETDAHLERDDPRERRLAEARRAVQQQMVDGLGTGTGGGDRDREVLLHALLADVVLERRRADGDVEDAVLFGRERRDLAILVLHRASLRRASRMRSSNSPLPSAAAAATARSASGRR